MTINYATPVFNLGGEQRTGMDKIVYFTVFAIDMGRLETQT